MIYAAVLMASKWATSLSSDKSYIYYIATYHWYHLISLRVFTDKRLLTILTGIYHMIYSVVLTTDLINKSNAQPQPEVVAASTCCIWRGRSTAMRQGSGQGICKSLKNPVQKTQQSEATAAKEHSNTLVHTRTHTLAHSFIDRQLNFPESRCLSRRRCRWQRQRLRLRRLYHPCCQCQRESFSHIRFPCFAFGFYLVCALLCAACVRMCVCAPPFVTNMKWKLAFHALTLDRFHFPISIPISARHRTRLRLRHTVYGGLSFGSPAAQRQCQRHSCRRSRSLSRQMAEQFKWKIFGYPFGTFLFSGGATTVPATCMRPAWKIYVTNLCFFSTKITQLVDVNWFLLNYTR